MGKPSLKANVRSRPKIRKEERRGRNKNRYAHLVPPRQLAYDKVNKTFRDLPVLGRPGEIILAGLRVVFHGRLYELMTDVTIGEKSVIPGFDGDKLTAIGCFKLVARID